MMNMLENIDPNTTNSILSPFNDTVDPAQEAHLLMAQANLVEALEYFYESGGTTQEAIQLANPFPELQS